MHSKLDIVKIKQMKRALLENLGRFYPSPVQIQTLYRTVCHDPDYNWSLMKKDIYYFKQKGWIEFVDDILGGADAFEKKVCRLTDEGKEIAEGTMTDPALEI